MASGEAYLPSYNPYSTLQSSMNSFMGTPQGSSAGGYTSSPLRYNMSLNSLRQTADPTQLNQPESSWDRIQAMSDRAYEKWKGDAMFKDRVYGEFQDAVSNATAGIPRTPGTFQDYKQYASNQGAAGLFGGSVAPIGQRNQNWNNMLFDNQAQQARALEPVYSQFGMMAPYFQRPQITTLQNPGW